ncbi:MAG: hypothetical protein KDC87_03890 [Planctomycetes bacterium]|nr:hypothetical protein [Planctomycetota bacterium]MCB9869865.1 hypothetical protein [Planctomycetota bacterium]MCB9889095.1 hypothetical protein [Planctomycetota bacterium]
MPKYRLIARVDDSSCSALLVRGRGRHSVVAWAGVCPDTRPEVLATYLREATTAAVPGQTSVLLLVSDRRIVTGRVERATPPPRRELVDLLRQAATERGKFAADVALGIGYHVTKTHDHWRVYFEAAPQQLFAPLVDAVRKVGYGSVQVLSTENLLAQGIATTDDVVAILDLRGTAAYFVLARNGQTLAQRKILLPAEVDPLAWSPREHELLLPLAAELSRSIEYFADHGLPRPTRLALTLPDGSAVELAELLGGALELPCETCADPALEFLPPDIPQRALGWAGHAFAAVHAFHKTAPFLADVRAVASRHAWRRRVLPAAGIAALVGGSIAIARIRDSAALARADTKAAAQQRLRALEAEFEIEKQRHAIPPLVVERSEILKQLAAGNVSLSRICALLGNRRPESVQFSEIKLADRKLSLKGLIADQSGLRAVAGFRALDELLRSVPGMVNGTGSTEGYDAKRGGLPFAYRIELGGRP